MSFVEWHPTADNILASVGFDNIIIVWDVSRGNQVSVDNDINERILSLNRNALHVPVKLLF